MQQSPLDHNVFHYMLNLLSMPSFLSMPTFPPPIGDDDDEPLEDR